MKGVSCVVRGPTSVRPIHKNEKEEEEETQHTPVGSELPVCLRKRSAVLLRSPRSLWSVRRHLDCVPHGTFLGLPHCWLGVAFLPSQGSTPEILSSPRNQFSTIWYPRPKYPVTVDSPRNPLHLHKQVGTQLPVCQCPGTLAPLAMYPPLRFPQGGGVRLGEPSP